MSIYNSLFGYTWFDNTKNTKQGMLWGSSLFIAATNTKHGLFGHSFFYSNKNDKHGLLGHTLFFDNDNYIQGIYGSTWFFEQSELPLKNAIYGYTYFFGKRFPPLGINPDFSVTEIPMFDTSIVTYGNTERRIANESTVQWKFKVKWSTLSLVEKNLIVNHFIERMGRAKNFYFMWTDIHENVQNRVVRFDNDILEIENFYYQLYSTNEVTLIELDEEN